MYPAKYNLSKPMRGISLLFTYSRAEVFYKQVDHGIIRKTALPVA